MELASPFSLRAVAPCNDWVRPAAPDWIRHQLAGRAVGDRPDPRPPLLGDGVPAVEAGDPGHRCWAGTKVSEGSARGRRRNRAAVGNVRSRGRGVEVTVRSTRDY